METTTKVCTICKIEKPCDEYHNDNRKKDGKYLYCKKCNCEKFKKWYQKNSDKKNEYNKKWKKENNKSQNEFVKNWRNQNLENIRQYEKDRRNSDPIYRMIANLRTRIYQYCQAIKANKTIRTKEMLGLDLDGFKSHIESKFQEGMTWENYGQWHVDHIKPISLARNEQEIVELNHYTNLQPLWASENIKKSNKYEEANHDHGNYGESFV